MNSHEFSAIMNLTTNDSLNVTDSSFLARTRWDIAVIGVVQLSICLLAFFGNLVVIAAIFKCDKLRDEPCNLFLVNLSFVDLGSSVFVMGSSFVSLVADHWPFGQPWCDFICMANYLFIVVSMLTLSLISVDRYQAIFHPLRYTGHVTKRKVLVAIVYTWTQGLCISVVPVAFRWIEYNYWEVVCAIQWYKQQHQAVYYVIISFVTSFLIPGMILVVCYGRVLRLACQKSSCDVNVHLSTTENYSVSRRAIISLLVVVVMFLICMAPFSVTKLYNVTVSKENSLPRYIYLIASLAAFLSSAVNPLIYGILRKDFKEAFDILLKRIKRKCLNFLPI
ncbi:octopamine receptor 1-like [Gigantopelta aegis]|uniref:octopamine receptor 1-like n=1 Tax=Gigantopelta aegis TaxID=1735272 RepID=UPI001B88CB27|nr:octopamine receptor 1-like [Gigantopelta aegis]